MKLTNILSEKFGKESQSTQFQGTTSNIPFYCLKEFPKGTLRNLLFVKEGHNVKIGLADDEIGHIEEGRDTLKRKIGLDGSINPLNAVDLEIFNLSHAVLRFQLGRFHYARQGTARRDSTRQCDVWCRNMIE